MFDKFVEIICNYVEVDPETITEDTRFMEDMGFTSFDFVSMLGEVEDEFDIVIDQQKAINIRTVGEAINYIQELINEN